MGEVLGMRGRPVERWIITREFYIHGFEAAWEEYTCK